MKTYTEILGRFGLLNEWDRFVATNPSNDLPYHNAFHTQCMIENCYEGAQYHNLPKSVTVDIIRAAMYHDFAHSGGHTDDTANVARAVAAARTLGYSDLVLDCIKCTEYPFVIEPFTIEERIIRDADLMQFRFPNWEKVLLHDLKAELEVSKGVTITDEEMIDGQCEFWKNIQFHTEWGAIVQKKEGQEFMVHIGAWRYTWSS